MRKGTYKLAVQTGAEAHYAQVSVEVSGYADDRIEIWCPDEQIRGWKKAVLAGMQMALDELHERGFAKSPVLVRMVSFTGIPTDTEDADAEVAAYMAVVDAFLDPQDNRPTLGSFQAGHWSIQWPM